MRKIFFIFVIVALALTSASCDRARAKDPRNVTLQERNYFLAVREAILTDNKQWLADNIALPLCCFPDKVNSKIRTRGDFMKYYDEVVTPYLKDVMQNQERDDLFKNWSGITGNNGAVWIGEFIEPAGRRYYAVFAINSKAPPEPPPPPEQVPSDQDELPPP